MNSTYQSVRVGLFFIIGLMLVWSLYETLNGNSRLVQRGYTVEAVFDDLQQLHIGDEVRLSGIRIGSVASTDLEGGKAHVKLFIDKDYVIPEDSVVTLTTAGLLGNNYLSIHAGTSPIAAKDGSTLASTPGANINDILTRISDISGQIESFLGQGKDHPAGGLFESLNNLLADNREKIDVMLSNMQSIAEKVNQSQGTIGLLINQRTAYDAALATIEGIRDVVNQAKSGQGVLGVLLYDPTAAEEIRDIIENIAEFSKNLNNKNSTLGQLINNDDLYRKADDVLNKVETAASTLADAGPLTVVGAAATTLF